MKAVSKFIRFVIFLMKYNMNGIQKKAQNSFESHLLKLYSLYFVRDIMYQSVVNFFQK